MNDKLNQLNKMLKGFDKVNCFYWINALLNLKEINEAEAGYLSNLLRGGEDGKL